MTVLDALNNALGMLNKVSVQGKDNIVNLGNSIVVIENVVKVLSAPPETASVDEVVDLGDVVEE